MNCTKALLIAALMAGPAHPAVTKYTCHIDELGEVMFITSGTEAVFVGNVGTATVTPIENAYGGITFVEVTPGGSVQVTAIDQNGVTIHSRHTMTASGMLPSQLKGDCSVSKGK